MIYILELIEMTNEIEICDQMVVRAISEKEARFIASESVLSCHAYYWLSENKSTCEIVPNHGESEVLVRSFTNYV